MAGGLSSGPSWLSLSSRSRKVSITERRFCLGAMVPLLIHLRNLATHPAIHPLLMFERETKFPSSIQGRRENSALPPRFAALTLLYYVTWPRTHRAVTGAPAAGLAAKGGFTGALPGEFGLSGASNPAGLAPCSPARWRLAYYSGSTCLVPQLSALRPGGPRGIRTLDLLNAIETRSQLRYGPFR